MDKPLKIKKIRAGLPSGIPFLGGLTIVFSFGLAAALLAASAAQAVAILPPLGAAPATEVTLPQFTVSPRSPHMEEAAAQIPAESLQESGWYHGVASWYGPSFNGKLTANGEVYDMYAMTAATSEFNTTLPLGTRARVVNSLNGRSVVVRITDRGPLPKGRIIDLSYGAARRLGMVKNGITHVRVHVLRWGSNRYNRRSAIASADRR
ncbi:MAG TPA: septal ring lytic transglycosylase RlpA family protein [Terracidiphilus sp.]